MHLSSDQITSKLTHWDAKVYEEWGQCYPESLSRYLKELGVSSVLDCAGGTGFPVIDLKKLGWDISYSDGMKESIEFFRRKKGELSIPNFLSTWSDLPKNAPQKYDAILCRGNSLSSNIELKPGEIDAEVAKKQVLGDLRGIRAVLNAEGVLFVDVCSPEYARPRKPIVKYDTHYVGETIQHTLSYDSTRDVKIAEYRNVAGEVLWRFESAPIDSSDLRELLKLAGYGTIERAKTPEPDRIEALIALNNA